MSLQSENIHIATRGGPREVEAWTRPEWRGLAIHRMPGSDGLWSVTHIRSGRAVTACRGKRAARRLAHVLSPLGDWTRSYEEVVNDEALHEACGLAVYGAEEWARRKAT